MAKTMGGDLVLQLLKEFREHQQDYKHFKHEMLEFKHDMLGFKQDYMGFKQSMEMRMDLLHEANVETLTYLKHIVRILQPMKTQLQDHEERLVKLEKE